jgi:hypothetical protein
MFHLGDLVRRPEWLRPCYPTAARIARHIRTSRQLQPGGAGTGDSPNEPIPTSTRPRPPGPGSPVTHSTPFLDHRARRRTLPSGPCRPPVGSMKRQHQPRRVRLPPRTHTTPWPQSCCSQTWRSLHRPTAHRGSALPVARSTPGHRPPARRRPPAAPSSAWVRRRRLAATARVTTASVRRSRSPAPWAPAPTATHSSNGPTVLRWRSPSPCPRRIPPMSPEAPELLAPGQTAYAAAKGGLSL